MQVAQAAVPACKGFESGAFVDAADTLLEQLYVVSDSACLKLQQAVGGDFYAAGDSAVADEQCVSAHHSKRKARNEGSAVKKRVS